VQAGCFPAAGVAELLHFTFKFNFFTFLLMKIKYAKTLLFFCFSNKNGLFSAQIPI